MTLAEAYRDRKDFQLSPNFSLMELIHSDTANAQGIDNWPQSLEIVENLQALAVNVLQPLRDKLGVPVLLSSGYRCPALNSAVGGVSNSEHLTGCAADIHVQTVSMKDLANYINKRIPQFNQLILEKWRQDNPQYGWVHVSYSRTHNKKELLTFDGSTYSPGLPA
jgi:zinc D-Ala-D-Ala carboxypeptidase